MGERRGGGEGSGACKIIVKDVVIVWRWGGGRGDESFSWGGGKEVRRGGYENGQREINRGERQQS